MGAATSIRVKGKIVKTDLPPNFFSVFQKQALMLANKQTEKWSKQIAKEAKRIIRDQEFKWKPLSEAYADYKDRVGLDPRILMATRDYVNNGIGWWKKGKRINVGPKPGFHEPSGLPYQLLGKWLEFGTERMPARQVWRPLLSRIIQRSKTFRKEYRAAVARAVRDGIKRKRTKTVQSKG